MPTKFIFVTGGVVSSIGKGISVASIGRILKSRGLSVSVIKLDPYLNVDPGTMSPYQHGEVFVTRDEVQNTVIAKLRPGEMCSAKSSSSPGNSGPPT